MKIKWVPPSKADLVAEVTLTRKEFDLLITAAGLGLDLMDDDDAEQVEELLAEAGYPR